ncbi:GAF domain-containing protein [Albibacterium sp.]|uniref:GAF domain-containing protein n=1 Tax=Albibacterium sp. TaxID=2952885 RepID=UPI002CE42973|nr:GAF domain-containing protein [Albibacterium sp.]HUH19635.1 GAF domain-containing protein [Albibacterium sp.]
MQTRVLTIEEHCANPLNLKVQLSFHPFLNYLKRRIEKEAVLKADYLRDIVNRIEKAIELNGPLSTDNFLQFECELALIYNFLVPPISTEEQTLWGLGFPVEHNFFYGTNSFYKLLEGGLCTFDLVAQPQIMDYDMLRVPYSVIFKNLYGFRSLRKEKYIRSFTDPKTGLSKYYQITTDDRFVDVHVQGELPDLDLSQISQIANKVNWESLQSTLPLANFSFEGFSIVTIKDITVSHVLENIKDMIMGTQLDFYDDRILDSLKTMVGDKDIEFELLPFLKLNGKLVLNSSKTDHKSPILELIKMHKVKEEELEGLIKRLLATRSRILVNAGVLSNSQDLKPIEDELKVLNIASYALIPILHHAKLVGVFEIYTKKENSLNENVLVKLEEVSPLLAQILGNASVKFQLSIDEVIKEKFTSLQSAVQWKFNEKAWEYLQNIQDGRPLPTVGNIMFENVFPLYGAVDIKNSTIERNKAFSTDIEIQLQELKKTLHQLNALLGIGLLEEMIFTCNTFLEQLKVELMDSFQMRVIDFLDREVADYLLHFKETDVRATEIIRKYEKVIDPETGLAYEHRRNLENSIQLVNTAINGYLELFNVEIQNSYPCYFEKFRTDGVEYDIYIGQSIAPEKPFNHLYLKNIRLWQLTSMAAMAGITVNLAPQMKIKLETTQLIFVNVNSIDISFRTDERRFDVEGTYNIRYEIIKKRIDKITIKDTIERLTQPGKIALVYMNSKDIEEYKSYILFLQKKGVLLDDLEELELEELNDVRGLKGLRVGVNYNQT